MYYDGKCNKWVELPTSSFINDYELFNNPRWYNKEKEDNIENSDTNQVIQKSKFIL